MAKVGVKKHARAGGGFAPTMAVVLVMITGASGCLIEDKELAEAQETSSGEQAVAGENPSATQFWNDTGGAWNVDQQVNIVNQSSNLFAAMGGWFINSDAWYMGFQQDGIAEHRRARFSIWNSTGAARGAGASCSFNGEANGYSCVLPFGWKADKMYKYRIWRVGPPDLFGQWWGAWIIDPATGAEWHIGNIRARPGATLVTSTYSFNERFFTSDPCHQVPYSKIYFVVPFVNNNERHGSYGAAHYNSQSCDDALITQAPGFGVSIIELGR